MSQSKLRVMTVVGTRPELIRLSPTIEKLDQYCEHHLVHTGQNFDYELNQIFFDDLGLRQPDTFLNAAGASAAETIGNVIVGSDRIMRKLAPEALLILGDTNSCLAAISAKRLHIPIFHMEAGNRCFDQRVPEETNRRIVDSIADINLTYSQIAREYLLREGFPPDRVIKTGSPMDEVLARHNEKIVASDVLARLKLQPEGYFVASMHREENVDSDSAFRRVLAILNGVAEEHGLPIILSTHPRTRKRLEGGEARLHHLVRSMRPLSFTDYVKLQCEARATLSDSGTISEESAILNFPALNLREAHERPEAMEEGSVMMVGLDLARVLSALTVLADQKRGDLRTIKKPADYNAANVSDKVLRIILSYTDYVRRTVWNVYPS